MARASRLMYESRIVYMPWRAVSIMAVPQFIAMCGPLPPSQGVMFSCWASNGTNSNVTLEFFCRYRLAPSCCASSRVGPFQMAQMMFTGLLDVVGEGLSGAVQAAARVPVRAL